MKTTKIAPRRVAQLLLIGLLVASQGSCSGCEDAQNCYYPVGADLPDRELKCCVIRGKPNCIYQVGWTSPEGDQEMAEFVLDSTGIGMAVDCAEIRFQSFVECP